MSGSKSIRLSKLLEMIGVNKKTEKAIEKVKTILDSLSLFVYPLLTMNASRNDLFQVSQYNILPLGDFFENERELEIFIKNSHSYKLLGIKTILNQYSPKGTNDILDFKGEDDLGNIVVLELKNKDGGKTAVEQVLRYTGYLKKQFPQKNIRTILVTGVKNPETEFALRGMIPEQQKNIEWYLYKYSKQQNTLTFEKVIL